VTLIFAGTLVNGADTIAIASLGYARDGAFGLDASRQLVTQLGASLDPPITFPEVFSDVRVQRNGDILVRRPYTEQELAALGPDDPRDGVDDVVGRIALTRFAGADGLASIGDSLYVATSNSPATDGFPNESGMGFLQGGYLEGSNVDMAEEMTSLMVATRVYQMNLAAYRAIQDMLEQASELA
jgi:flagellar basal-body rod protein FlgG